eukprot:2896650-Pleurochrysis_carterae.AAC.1
MTAECGAGAGADETGTGRRIGSTHASHEQGRPRTRSQTVLLRRRRRAALAGRSSSQVGLAQAGAEAA